MSTGITGLDNLLGENKIQTSTITGIVGPHGCRKSIIPLTWLAYGSVFDKQHGLFITFKDIRGSFVSFLKEKYKSVYLHIKKNYLNGREINNDFEEFDQLLEVDILSFKTDGLTSGEILYGIDKYINKQKEKVNKDLRIYIEDLEFANMASNFIEEDTSFYQAFKEIIKTNRIASIISFSSEPVFLHGSKFEKLFWLICDNLIGLRKLEMESFERIAIFALKTVDNKHLKDARELIVSDDSIEVKSNFILYKDIRIGDPKPVKINIILHYEGHVQYVYNEKLKNYIEDITTTEVILHNKIFPVSQSIDVIKGSAIAQDIRILQVDDPYLETIEYNNVIHISKNEIEYYDDYFSPIKQRIFCEENSSIWATPYIVNIPVLLINQESDRKEFNSWDDLANWNFDRGNEKNVGFDFPKKTVENYNSIFLEILFSKVSEGYSYNDDFISPKEKEFEKILEIKGKETAITFWKLCHYAYVEHNKRKENIVSGEDANTLDILGYLPNSLCCRAWYSSITEIIDEKKEMIIKRLPGKVETLGTWYLIAPKNCASPELVRQLIVEICKRDNAIERFEKGYGLPPYKSLYENEGIKQDKNSSSDDNNSPLNFARASLAGAIDKPIIRGKIDGYNKKSSLMSFYLRRILELSKEGKKEPGNKIEEIFEKMISAIS